MTKRHFTRRARNYPDAMGSHASDFHRARKARGAFFTPPAIADYLAAWAVDGDPGARVLDPTCGESVFLEAAGRRFVSAGVQSSELSEHVFGVDIEGESVKRSKRLLREADLNATLLVHDFFDLPTPDRLGCPLPAMDAVIGNPPFIRYQEHKGRARAKAASAALAQGVRLSGLASSWAALVVHACGFLKPEGRLAMVLPAELLTVGYAEPIRRWLRQRFAAVHLVMFERLQFLGATEKVVLVIARGQGGCDAFSLLPVEDAEDLSSLRLFGPSHFSVAPAAAGKWTDLLLPLQQRQTFKRVADEHFVDLGQYGSPELGTVTGANQFFALSESTRKKYSLRESQLMPISPPGTKHLRGLSFTKGAWARLRDQGESVWLLHPDEDDRSAALRRYLRVGEAVGVPDAYKCRIRDPWWKPPVVPVPDLFFTYMSHRYPRLVRNTARVGFVNSMHGIRLRSEVPKVVAAALPLLCLNSVTMLGAEVFGRSYGGGVLKMEPREAAALPVPSPLVLQRAFEKLRPDRDALDRQLRAGKWTSVVKRVDEVLLRDCLNLPTSEAICLHEATIALRARRLGSPSG
jgi:adenine-specific DNA-methyltransferase